MGTGGGRHGGGSYLLLTLVAAVLLRPWEEVGRLLAAPEARSAWARVERVVDGDTLEVSLGGRREDIRLIGVDTPETVDPGSPVQCFGPRASRFQHRLAEGRRLRLVFGAERRDAYGRLLSYAYLGDRFVNAILVRRGLARTLTIPPNDRFAKRFEQLQRAAAQAGRGLWGAC